jgi:gamma-glutamyltranspeptidase/glutathione hydrolase
LCPTLVTRPDGSLAGVIGTMGGDTQPQILLQLLARWLGSVEEPGDVLAAGRWALAPLDGGSVFDTWRARGQVQVVLEGQVSERWAEGLTSRGHRVTTVGAFDRLFGHAHLITVADDHLAGATDPRPRFGAAAGY